MRRTALAVMAAGVALMAGAYASAWQTGGTPVWGIWCMIAGSAAIIGGMVVLTAARSGVRARLAALLGLVLFVILVAGFGLPMVMPPEQANSPLFLGLPYRAALEVYGVGLLPALFLPLAFAAAFRDEGLDAESLASLRAECDRLRAPHPSDPA
jgi:hypothetical protein